MWGSLTVLAVGMLLLLCDVRVASTQQQLMRTYAMDANEATMLWVARVRRGVLVALTQQQVLCADGRKAAFAYEAAEFARCVHRGACWKLHTAFTLLRACSHNSSHHVANFTYELGTCMHVSPKASLLRRTCTISAQDLSVCATSYLRIVSSHPSMTVATGRTSLLARRGTVRVRNDDFDAVNLVRGARHNCASLWHLHARHRLVKHTRCVYRASGAVRRQHARCLCTMHSSS